MEDTSASPQVDRSNAVEAKQAPASDAERFREALKRLRVSKGLTQHQLGKLAFLSRPLVNQIEKGARDPTPEAAEALDKALNARGALVELALAVRAELPYFNLPQGPHRFVGREDVMDTISALMEPANALVCVTGEPGVGKSAVALRWANAARDRGALVLFSNLRGYSSDVPAHPEEILEELLLGLSVTPDRIPSTEHTRKSLFQRLLAQREVVHQRIYVVLDNARDSQQVLSVLPGASNAAFLVTSRNQMKRLVVQTSAERIMLESLDRATSKRLTASLIGTERVDSEPAAVDRLVDLCAHLPLALSIAAERIHAHPTKTIEQHVNDLQAAARLLDRLEVADDDTTGVRPAFNWSYAALPDNPARLFRLLGIHPGPRFSVQAATALLGSSEEETLASLDELIQVHLVQPAASPSQGQRSFTLHDLLYAYAAEESASERWSEDTAAARSRLVQWYVHTANAASWQITPGRAHHVRLPPPADGVSPRAFADFGAAFRWCVEELSNITAIATSAVQHGLVDEAWQIAVEMYDFLIHYRPWQAWISLYETALRAADASEDAWQIAVAANHLAEAYRRSGQLERARQLYARAITEAERLGPNECLGYSLTGLGECELESRKYDSAVRLMRQALVVQTQGGSSVAQAYTHLQLGSAYREQGIEESALDHGRLAFDILVGDDDSHGIGTAAVPLARTLLRFGHYDEALTYCDVGLREFRRCEDYGGEADALGARGLVLVYLGRREEGLATIAQAVEMLSSVDTHLAGRLESEVADLTGLL
ncbi:hypothetical protein DL991_10700 [Amycolatopsis sp. WAC 01375]|uniref:tetratricopeptide repeat protein n=1 Tax=Amycolatopsis sp. WAC 01375 TaxID=2203194 RepID=UPI000F76E584|nr:tetratricopeptide repeat protein [Amycolatopsis sp. WAC 01375]RSM80571.1 hypothetical protein DL991_10700 [Amycolatopsis sp. WAC 01375]